MLNNYGKINFGAIRFRFKHNLGLILNNLEIFWNFYERNVEGLLGLAFDRKLSNFYRMFINFDRMLSNFYRILSNFDRMLSNFDGMLSVNILVFSPSGVQRLLHHELPGPSRQGYQRQLHHPRG